MQRARSTPVPVVVRRTRSRDDVEHRAEFQFQTGKFAEASATFTRLIDRNPENAYFRERRALCFEKLSDFESAKEDFLRCIELEPTEAKHHITFADFYKRIGDMMMCEKELKEALRLDPDNIRLQLDVSRLYRNRRGEQQLWWPRELTAEDDEPVRQDFAEIQLNPRMKMFRDRLIWHLSLPAPNRMSPEKHRICGNQAFQEGRFEEALASYNRAIAGEPDNLAYWNCKSAALMKLGRYEEVIEACRTGIEQAARPTRNRVARMYQRMAAASLHLHQLKDARAAFELALTQKKSELLAGEVKRLKKLEQRMEIDGDKAEEVLAAGDVLMRDGDYEKAIDAYHQVLFHSPKDARAYARLAAAQEAVGQFGAAMLMCEKALKHGPSDAALVAFVNPIKARVHSAVIQIQHEMQRQPTREHQEVYVEPPPRPANDAPSTPVAETEVDDIDMDVPNATEHQFQNSTVDQNTAVNGQTDFEERVEFPVNPAAHNAVSNFENGSFAQQVANEQMNRPVNHQNGFNTVSNGQQNGFNDPELEERKIELFRMWRRDPDGVRRGAASDPFFREALQALIDEGRIPG